MQMYIGPWEEQSPSNLSGQLLWSDPGPCNDKDRCWRPAASPASVLVLFGFSLVQVLNQVISIEFRLALNLRCSSGGSRTMNLPCRFKEFNHLLPRSAKWKPLSLTKPHWCIRTISQSVSRCMHKSELHQQCGWTFLARISPQEMYISRELEDVWSKWGHWCSPASGTQVTSSQYINLSYSVSQLNALYCTHRVGMECSCVYCGSQLPCIKLGHEDAASGSVICACHSSLRAVTLGTATSCLPRYECFDNWQLFSPFLGMCGFKAVIHLLWY